MDENGPFLGDVPIQTVIFHSYISKRLTEGKKSKFRAIPKTSNGIRMVVNESYIMVLYGVIWINMDISFGN